MDAPKTIPPVNHPSEAFEVGATSHHKASAAMHPKLTAKQRAILMRDQDECVRMCVAAGPTVTIAELRVLCVDPSDDVKAAAMRSLGARNAGS